MSSAGSYDPHAIEPEIYKFWEAGGYFHAEPDPRRQPYVIDIPLPNVTGALHLGHALNNTIQDLLIRHKRMSGYNALWMPGTDHAGIATQAVVEKRLKEEENLTRHELGRDGLVARIWAWKEKYGDQILKQLRRMGCSCDWPRTRFTLDDVCAKAVYEAFFRLFKDGLIYRGLRLVNWDAHLQTAVADDEIIHETVKGHLWNYRYPVLKSDEATEPRSHEGVARSAGTPTGSGMFDVEPGVAGAAIKRAASKDAKEGVDYLAIATTRPETMLGDTALAVHPEDERYQHLIGQYVLLPLQNRAIPVIADAVLVKREFGTGVVKVTPGHDPNDYACAQRKNLQMINILTVDGRINENGGSYAGLSIQTARKKVVADLEALGLMETIEPYETEVGHSDRSKTPIEPMLSEQWFVKMGDLAELAIAAARDGRVQFFPARYAQMYLDWLGEKRDWCISRQLWWGHRIPVWTWRGTAVDVLLKRSDWAEINKRLNDYIARGLLAHQVLTERAVTAQADVFDRRVARIHSYFCPAPHFMSEFAKFAESAGMEEDADVLDTWFSSALWPFSTLGWPESNPDLDYFFPTSTLVTGRGIVTLWVARMVMTSLYFLKEVPFRHVVIHPIIQDGQGRTMSKSLGNGVDPLDIIELYGTDSMRFTLVQMATETQDVRMPVKPVKLPDGRTINSSEKFELGRNLCNKLWQAATGFVLPNLDGYAPQPLKRDDLAIEDRWILSRLTGCIAEADRRLERYQFSELANALYAFFWNDFCDWHVELVKPRLFSRNAAGGVERCADASAATARQVLAWVLDQTLRLLHPLMPFATEALWQRLNEAAPRRGIEEPRDHGPALIVAAWPQAAEGWRDTDVESELELLQSVIRGLRDIRARVNSIRAASKQPSLRTLPRAAIRAAGVVAARLNERAVVVRLLGQCDEMEIGPGVCKPPESASALFPGVEVYVPLAGLADLSLERQRLRQEHDELTATAQRLEAKLGHAGFVDKAPAAVVEKERARLAELQERLATIARHLAEIG